MAPGAGVLPPSMLHQTEPVYPPMALRTRASGVVDLKILVGVDGSVEDVRIDSVSRKGVGFEKAAEDAVRQWRYRPATKHGVKVKMWLPIRIPFTIR